MKLSRTNRNTHRRRAPAAAVSVPSEQGMVRVPASVFTDLPTKPSKALVAAVLTIAGLLGLHLTSGTAQAVVVVLQVVLVTYGVWRTRNVPKATPERPGVGDFL
jgi:hypothetical protein